MRETVLLYGERDPATVAINMVALDPTSTGTITIPDAEIAYSLFEIRMRDAQALLPPSLHPSVPALIGVTFIRARGGPLGAFNLAYCGIACRTGIKPRHYIQSAFADCNQASEFFTTRYGFPCQTATIELRESYDRIHGRVETEGGCVLETTAVDCVPLVGSGAMVKYSPPLNVTQVGGQAALVQFEAAYDFKRVLRGKPALNTFDSAVVGEDQPRPNHAISGTFAVVDLHLMPVRFEVDLSVPAEQGGARKIAR